MRYMSDTLTRRDGGYTSNGRARQTDLMLRGNQGTERGAMTSKSAETPLKSASKACTSASSTEPSKSM